jgi:thiamine-phosphate pyrophosphorylase
MLIFTPELCRPSVAPREVLTTLLPRVDAVQIRLKEPGQALGPAHATYAWTKCALELRETLGCPTLVLVNDRVDVAKALAEVGVDGVHLGAEDAPSTLARQLLGDELLIGLSTHSMADVAAAGDQPVDYLGFGPIHPTTTKGYVQGRGAEAAWVAARACAWPLFPIGGIELENAGELAPIGRAALARALLAAPDPAACAQALRRELRDQT